MAVLVLGVMPARASVPDLFGFGARGIALGNAIHGSATGFESVWYNPAGMAWDDELTFTLGYQWGRLALEVNDESWDARDTPALVFGFGIPLPLGEPLADRFSLAMGFVLPTTSILIADTKPPGDLTHVVVENRAQTVSIQGGAAVRLCDWFSVGWSILALAELEGGIDVAPNSAGNLGSQARDQLVTDYSNAFGVSAVPIPDRLGVGVVYRQESAAHYSLPISVDLGDSFQIPVPLLNISGTAQFDPAQLSAAVWARPVPELSIEAGITHKWWSRFRNPVVYTAVPDEYPAQPEPGFSNTVVWKLGVEGTVDAGSWVLQPRAGFAWEPSPVPAQTGLHNYLDSDRAIPSLGLGARVGPLRLAAAWQMHLLADRTEHKDCVDDGTGVSDLPPEDGARVPPTYPSPNPGCPSVSHGGTIQVVNVEVGVAF